jgi:deoxyhypusine synthase
MPASDYLSGQTIAPRRLTHESTITELVESAFGSFNAGRLREGCRLFVERMLEPDALVGVTLTGALTPTGLGASTLIPLIEAGFIDWIVATGGNLYHDAHFALGLPLHRGNPFTPDPALRETDVVRIYDIFLDHQVLLDTDAFFRELIRRPEFRRRMSTAEFHHLCGGYLAERERALGTGRRSLLAACHDYDVPVYTPSSGDSSIGMIIAAATLEDGAPQLDPSADVNEAAALVHEAKAGGRSAALVLGGGSPKNFIMQTEPYLQEVLGIEAGGHDYFLQITDTRPDTGSLSGAPPVEPPRDRDSRDGHGGAGGSRPGSLRHHTSADGPHEAVTCYTDVTIALPILAAYALANREPRVPRRSYRRRAECLERLRHEVERAARDESARERVRRDQAHHVTLERNR